MLMAKVVFKCLKLSLATYCYIRLLHILFRSLIKGRPSDGFPLGTEDFIRQAIREFTFPETTVLRQLVTSIAPVNKVIHYCFV